MRPMKPQPITPMPICFMVYESSLRVGFWGTWLGFDKLCPMVGSFLGVLSRRLFERSFVALLYSPKFYLSILSGVGTT